MKKTYKEEHYYKIIRYSKSTYKADKKYWVRENDWEYTSLNPIKPTVICLDMPNIKI